MKADNIYAVTYTSPASATTAINSTKWLGLHNYHWFTIDAVIQGATGGTLDIYLQRLVNRTSAGVETWADWIHFTQLAAGASAVQYTAGPNADNTINEVGTGDATTATPALAANTFVGGHPGRELRIVSVAGAGTSAGASQTIYVRGQRFP